MSEDLFSGPSECAALMRAFDWTQTPLGPPSRWPRSLQTIVPIMLASRFAMRVLWGRELIILYNDAYRPILGAKKHPRAMGQPMAEVYQEVWDIIGPLFYRVRGGEAVAVDDLLLPLERSGYIEECYFTLSYSPIVDDAGVVDGVLGVVHESTDRLLAVRRLQTLRSLAEYGVPSVAGALKHAAATFERHPIDVPFSIFYLLDDQGRRATMAISTGLAENSPLLLPTIDLAANPKSPIQWPLAAAIAQRASLEVDLIEEAVAGVFPEPVRRALLVPMMRSHDDRCAGFIVVGVNPRRVLDSVYREFFNFATETIIASVFEALDRQERARLIASERAADSRLRLLFNDAPAAVALLRGKELVFELANPPYCKLAGRSDLIGRSAREAVPELAKQGVWDIFDRVFATGEPFFGKEIPISYDRLGNGELDQGFFNVTVQPMLDVSGGIEGVMCFANEITELVVARKAEASARVNERTARAEAERSNNAKDEFLAVVSHELRNPLSAMLGWTQLLRSGQLNESKRQDALETIERNALSQSQLIEDLLDVSRIVSGKLRLEVRMVNFVEVVQAALDSARPAIDGKQLRLKVVLDPEAGALMGDAVRLQQIVWNLLTNATKFTPKGGSIQVVLKRLDSMIELSVSDTGSGVPVEFLPHVFERFKQADASSTRSHGGLGLGLSIAKNLVEMHGGTISAHSDGENRGATFVVRLPIAPLRQSSPAGALSAASTSARARQAWDSPPELVGLRVLVVDDDADGRKMIAAVLELCGCIVLHASSAKEAFVEFQTARPDILLSDIGMPDEDGYSLIRRIRHDAGSGGATVPAASITAYASPEDRRRALIAGFHMHVAKPVDPAELIATVSSLGRIARAIK